MDKTLRCPTGLTRLDSLLGRRGCGRSAAELEIMSLIVNLAGYTGSSTFNIHHPSLRPLPPHSLSISLDSVVITAIDPTPVCCGDVPTGKKK